VDEKKMEDLKNKVITSLETDNMSVSSKRLMATFIDVVSIASVTAIVHIPLHFMASFLPVFLWKMISCVVLSACGAAVLLKDAPYQFAILDKQSIGKKALHLRVVKVDTQAPISMADSIARNTLLSIPFFFSAFIQLINIIPIPVLTISLTLILSLACLIIGLAIYGFEVYTLFKDIEGRRFGDQKAGTMVILE